MIETEKVIKGLEICSEYGSWHGLDCEHNEAYKDCPYRGCETGCIVTIAKDAIALLKEREPMKPKVEHFELHYASYDEYENRAYCPKCGIQFIQQVNYCPKCGQAVKWE